MSEPGIILQARIGSSRLRAKVLEPVGGRTILHQCLRRLSASGLRVVLATTSAPEDDVLEAMAVRLGVPVHRGERDDVLARYVNAATEFDIDPVIRATADNPAVDVDGPARVLAVMRETGADYVCESGLPHGAAVEAVSLSVLRYSAIVARNPLDREHVTTFIKSRSDRFRVEYPEAPLAVRRPGLRVTVDTHEDLAWIRELYFRAGTDDPSLAQLVAAADRAQREAA
jgi:spore coat polysaccharide biosynthesis protein SpsF